MEDTTVDGLPVKYYSHQGGKIAYEQNERGENRILDTNVAQSRNSDFSGCTVGRKIKILAD